MALLKYWDNTAQKWVEVTGYDLDTVLNRANHSGTQLLSTISDAGDLAGKNLVSTTDLEKKDKIFIAPGLPSGGGHNGSYGPCFLIKKKVRFGSTYLYSDSAGTLTVSLVEHDNGDTGPDLATRTFTIRAGYNALYLGFDLGEEFVGKTIRIKSDSPGDLWRTDAGTGDGAIWDIDSELVQSFEGANSSGATADRYYYYFNLEITEL